MITLCCERHIHNWPRIIVGNQLQRTVTLKTDNEGCDKAVRVTCSCGTISYIHNNATGKSNYIYLTIKEVS